MNLLNKNNFSAKDFIQYHSGKMSDTEMHKMEESALDDNFLSDALDGYIYSNNAEKNLLEIKNNIDAKSKATFKSNASIRKIYFSIGIAASLIIILFVGYFNISNKSEVTPIIAKVENIDNNSDQATNPLNNITPQQEINTKQNEIKAKVKLTVPITIPVDEMKTASNTESSLQSVAASTNINEPPLPVDNSIQEYNNQTIADKKIPISAAPKIIATSSDKDKFKETEVSSIKSVKISNAPEYYRAVSATASKSEIKNDDANNNLSSSPVEGWNSFNKYIRENKKIVTDSMKNPCKGLLILSFNVNNNGAPVDFKVERSIEEACNNAGIKLIKNGPKWNKNDNNRIVYKINF